MSQLLAYHRGMLADTERVDAYRGAIAEAVSEGDVVVDVGAGTGVLSYFACQAGARRVYAIEAGPILAVARLLAQANGFSDRVQFVAGHSSQVELPEPADVLVTETLWNFGIGEGVLGFLQDARRRFLAPGARIVPQAVDLYVAPVEAEDFYAALAQGPPDRHGLSFAPMRPFAVNNVYVPRVDTALFVGERVKLASVDLTRETGTEIGAEATLPVTRAGVVHGIAGWFEARLFGDWRLGNAPPAPGSSWAHVLFPLERPVEVAAGDELRVRIDTVGNGTTWRWATEVNGARFDQTSLFGFPLGAGR